MTKISVLSYTIILVILTSGCVQPPDHTTTTLRTTSTTTTTTTTTATVTTTTITVTTTTTTTSSLTTTSLSGTTKLEGTIQERSSGNFIKQARITLFTTDLSFFREARSDGQGYYQFGNIPAGSYQLGVAALGQEYEEVAVVISESLSTKSFNLGPETNKGKWSFTGDTSPENFQGTGTATLLPNGEIFFCHDSKDPVIFNFTTKTKRFPKSTEDFGGKKAAGHATFLLMNGDVFLAGGGDGIGGGPQGANPAFLKQSKIYRPNNDTWTILPDMSAGHWYPSIVRLPDKRIMVMGGDSGSPPGGGNRNNIVEIYDPDKKTWTLAAPYKRPQEMSPALVLYTGKILKTWRDVETYDIGSNKWSDAAQMLQSRRGAPAGEHSDHTLTMFPDGRVASFGIDPTNDNNDPKFVEIYDPSTDSWSFGSQSRAVRQRPEVQMLPGGKILVYGGEYTGTGPSPVTLSRAGNVQKVTKITDLYDPKTDSWRSLADMNRFIHFHSIGGLLPDGRVINTNGAGVDETPFGRDMRIEAFEPPYMFRGVRPKIDSLSTNDMTIGETFSIRVSRTSTPTEVVLIGMRAETHWIDSGPNRYLSLNFTYDGAQIKATIINDRIKALPGWYILFVMVDDIPSEGKIVRIL
ncbi:MAG: DUF1929 domain-containing protein [Candidatus Aenigmarchaeota archaeon]|nr:DUF1929 domain-containing protein [Candidatus Aenigmarchaeota archaeon]